jgi:DNA polymerase-1
MVLSYHLCVEPQGLKALAFRHAGMEMDSYDEIISDAQDRIAVDYYELIESLCADGVTYATAGVTVYTTNITLSLPGKQPDVFAAEYDELEEAEADLAEYRNIHGKRFKHTKLKKVTSKPTEPTNVGPFQWVQPYTILERDKTTGQLKERTKTVMQIHQRVANALKGLREGKLTAADIRKRWNGTDDMIVDLVEAVIGPMREAGLDDVPLDRAVRYAARDADATHRIYPIVREKHSAMGLEYTSTVDHDIIPMVDRMQEVGIEVDVDYFQHLSADLERRMIAKQQEIKERFGVWINPNSGDQVAELLFRPVEEGGYGLEASKKTKGTIDAETGEVKKRRGSTQDKVLEGLRSQHPIIPLILDYRGLNKAKTSFADVAIRNARFEDGRWKVHCKFRVTRVSSGRLSATGPNLMAVMGGALGLEIRAGYTAGDGEFAAWDLNQIEMRVMASEANDAFLISMFLTDEDVHTGTADRMFKLGLKRPYNKKQVDKDKHRDPAKRTGFGVITGIQAPGLVDQMRLQGIIVSEDEAAQWIIDWLAACPAVPEYMQRCHREAMAYGYVRDWAGRIRYLPGIHSPFRHVRAEAGRQSHSHKIQAGAQSIMKIAMAKIWREVLPYWWARGRNIQPILQVHDELILWLPPGMTAEEKEELDGQMRACLFSSAPAGFRIPLDAGNGFARNWALLEH